MVTPTKIRSTTPTIDVYVKLAQYPILCDQIRLRMREELFRRGIADQTEFEFEVKQLAEESQRREGLNDPLSQEDDTTWQRRMDMVRDLHTDNYFGNNLGPSVLEHIIHEVLNNQHGATLDNELHFNPEIAPWEILFQQGRRFEALPPPQQELVKHHLEELKVVLIKRLISDNLNFIGVAKHVFSIRDLRWIYERQIGGGKIGGKAAGILLSLAILKQKGDTIGPDINDSVAIPESYFIGSEIIYEFIYINKLERFVNQKYLPEEEMRSQYPKIVEAFAVGEFPDYVIDQLKEILKRMGKRPYVVRSSSLLEDNFSYSFAGKYASCFCFNEEDEEKDLKTLTDAIRQIYASVFNPEAMAFRSEHGLIDYDERMAVMIQPLRGTKYGRYFWPTISGTGISCNPLQETKRTMFDDGILRLVWGYDDTIGDLFDSQDASIIPLKKPKLHTDKENIHRIKSPQNRIKVIDIPEQKFKQLPVEALLQPGCPDLPYIATTAEGNPISQENMVSDQELILTFDYLKEDQKFIKLMRTSLMRLENVYGTPVIVEFVIDLIPNASGLDYKLYILQCHPYLEE